MARNDTPKGVKCSFCGKTQESVKKIVAGPGVYICNECIGLCNEIIESEYCEEDEDTYTLAGLDKIPRKIETYDISNISGEYMVAGMCVMVDGTIKGNMSRRFKIKTVLTQDDPKCMQEVVTR